MSIAKIISGVISLFNKLFDAWQRKKIKDEGKAELKEELRQELDEQLKDAEAARTDPDLIKRVQDARDSARNHQ